ncbi:MAG: endonuclease/exonuclease/phosphatase family protein [Candidatus Poribacteria bacterium]|nr:endonuclease/exonuclease/phosphatase family protein [Candidatus Poribacteria bacterium]
MAHFKVQYLAVLCFCGIAAAVARRWRWFVVALFGICINGIAVYPWYTSDQSHLSASGEPELRILFSNVHVLNQQHEKLIELVETELPDLLILQEISNHWVRSFETVGLSYPNKHLVPRNDSFGIGIFSRIPIHMSEVFYFGELHPSILAILEIGGERVTILALHPPPPVSEQAAEDRNELLEATASYFREIQTPKLIVGDLNTTMWSRNFTRFVHESGLKNARRGFGILPTWPTYFPLMYIPIDHCLVSSDITVVDMRTGPDFGSDHLPLIVDLSLTSTNLTSWRDSIIRNASVTD